VICVFVVGLFGSLLVGWYTFRACDKSVVACITIVVQLAYCSRLYVNNLAIREDKLDYETIIILVERNIACVEQ
jgi:hypothetical protein